MDRAKLFLCSGSFINRYHFMCSFLGKGPFSKMCRGNCACVMCRLKYRYVSTNAVKIYVYFTLVWNGKNHPNNLNTQANLYDLFSWFSVGLSDDPVQRTKEGLEVNQNDPLNKLSKKKLHSYLLIFFHTTCRFNLINHF